MIDDCYSLQTYTTAVVCDDLEDFPLDGGVAVANNDSTAAADYHDDDSPNATTASSSAADEMPMSDLDMNEEEPSNEAT